MMKGSPIYLSKVCFIATSLKRLCCVIFSLRSAPASFSPPLEIASSFGQGIGPLARFLRSFDYGLLKTSLLLLLCHLPFPFPCLVYSSTYPPVAHKYNHSYYDHHCSSFRVFTFACFCRWS